MRNCLEYGIFQDEKLHFPIMLVEKMDKSLISLNFSSKPYCPHRKRCEKYTKKVILWITTMYQPFSFLYFFLQTKYAPESVNLGTYLELLNGQHFQASDDIRRIYVIFGLKNQDLSDCHKSDPTCFGKTVWDEKFNMDAPRIQQSFLVRGYYSRPM